MLHDALFSVAVAAYGLASALLLLHLAGRDKAPLSGPRVLLGAALAHVGADVVRWALRGVHPFDGIAPTLSFVSLGSVVAYLAVRRARPRVESVGAFVAPVAFVLVIASRFAHRPNVHPATTGLLASHLAAGAVSLASLTLACAMCLAYLLLDREMKARRLGGLFRRLPPLEVLDGLAYRAVSIGTAALTLAVVTGHLVSVRAARVAGPQWQQYFALTAWVLFAVVLLLRVAAGWRGRRMAIGTLVGYASAVLVLVFYAVRARGAA